jgi:hypothetical protein
LLLLAALRFGVAFGVRTRLVEAVGVGVSTWLVEANGIC